MDQWVQHLGPALEYAVPYLRRTGRLASSWPCDEPEASCWRSVVRHGDEDLVAVCREPPGRCPPLPLTVDQLAVHRLDLPALLGHVSMSLDLEPAGKVEFLARPGQARLGRHRFGNEVVDFYWSGSGESAALLALAAEAGELDGPASIVILVPDDGEIPPVLARQLRDGGGIEVLGLDLLAAVHEGGLRFGLADWVLRRRFAGIDPPRYLWPRFQLVIDPARDRYWLGPNPIAFSPKATIGPALLVALARRAGETVPNDDLYAEVWPDLWGSANVTREDLNPRLRDQKLKLDRLLRAAGEGVPGLPSPAVVNVPGRTEADGAYRLDVEADRVAWWSKPP